MPIQSFGFMVVLAASIDRLVREAWGVLVISCPVRLVHALLPQIRQQAQELERVQPAQSKSTSLTRWALRSTAGPDVHARTHSLLTDLSHPNLPSESVQVAIAVLLRLPWLLLHSTKSTRVATKVVMVVGRAANDAPWVVYWSLPGEKWIEHRGADLLGGLRAADVDSAGG